MMVMAIIHTNVGIIEYTFGDTTRLDSLDDDGPGDGDGDGQ